MSACVPTLWSKTHYGKKTAYYRSQFSPKDQIIFVYITPNLVASCFFNCQRLSTFRLPYSTGNNSISLSPNTLYTLRRAGGRGGR